jgi:hypothetical protein
MFDRGDGGRHKRDIKNAVFSPEKCLCAGGHFYTAATMAMSIDMIRCQLTGHIYENEDISHADFDILTFIFTHADRPGIFTERQKKELAGSAKMLLWELSVDVKKAQKAKDPISKQKYLLEVQNWSNNRQSIAKVSDFRTADSSAGYHVQTISHRIFQRLLAYP